MRLPGPRLSVRDNRGVVPGQNGADARPGRGEVDVFLRRRRRVDGVKRKAVRRVEQVLVTAVAVTIVTFSSERRRRRRGGICDDARILAQREGPAARVDADGRGVASRVAELAGERRADTDDDLLIFLFFVFCISFIVCFFVGGAICCCELFSESAKGGQERNAGIGRKSEQERKKEKEKDRFLRACPSFFSLVSSNLKPKKCIWSAFTLSLSFLSSLVLALFL